LLLRNLLISGSPISADLLIHGIIAPPLRVRKQVQAAPSKLSSSGCTHRLTDKIPRNKVSLLKNRRLRASSRGNIVRMFSPRKLSLPFFGILFIFTLSTISITCYNYPLFPTQIDRLDWAAAWLKATVADYYGSTLCFSGIVLSSEPSWTVGCIWVAAFCLAGSPACCLWVILRLLRRGSLKLEEGSRNSGVIGTESERLS
jgi:Protein of unknown function (DUF1475)